MKTNEEYLRELIAHDDEAIEFLDALIKEYKGQAEPETGSEVDDLKDEIDELRGNLSEFTVVDLGLDILHYKLEKGNLRMHDKLENLIRRCNTIPNAEPLFV